MIAIKINGNEYYYHTFSYEDGEAGTYFYKKGDPIKRRKITRKYWLFGPILKDEIVEEENYIDCFRINECIKYNPDDRVIMLIKKAEEEFQIHDAWKSGKISI